MNRKCNAGKANNKEKNLNLYKGIDYAYLINFVILFMDSIWVTLHEPRLKKNALLYNINNITLGICAAAQFESLQTIATT